MREAYTLPGVRTAERTGKHASWGGLLWGQYDVCFVWGGSLGQGIECRLVLGFPAVWLRASYLTSLSLIILPLRVVVRSY